MHDNDDEQTNWMCMGGVELDGKSQKNKQMAIVWKLMSATN